ncbi:hypothetical protein CVT24_002274 [Panaeolus cyanescens]|uniref:MYND-type domain-containing protein n=1 Tax=Panaeolus cyanescens TaxID=181874 RepID=A0A409X4W8_9AGAR|nr:hypothetical protein CVT24_002274 [Panaeolus cyanescens]
MLSNKYIENAQVAQLPDFSTVLPAIRYLLSALRDPLNPKGCAESLCTALSQVALYHFVVSKPHAAIRDELRASLYAFITIPRTDGQLKATIQQLGKCSSSCHLAAPRFHLGIAQSKPGIEKSFMECFMIIAFEKLSMVLNLTNTIHLLKRQRKSWPTSMSDLLPFGPDKLVANLVQWYHMFPTPQAVRFSLAILKRCGPLVYHAFRDADVSNILFINHTRIMVDEMLAASTPNMIFALSEQYSNQVINFLRFFKHLIGYDNVYKPVSSVDGTPVSMMTGAETKIVQLCSLICYIASSPHVDKDPSYQEGISSHTTEACVLAHKIYRAFRMDQAPGPALLLHPIIVAGDRTLTQTTSGSKCRKIASAMYIRRYIYICGAPGCKTCFTNPDAVLRTCTGCKTVRYCSTECQERDWKGAPYKHKWLCKLLAKVAQSFGSWKLAPIDEDADYLEEDIDRRREMVENLAKTVYEMLPPLVGDGRLGLDEFMFLQSWAANEGNWDYMKNAEFKIPDKWGPGFDDYDEVLQRIQDSRLFNGEKGER